MKRFFLTSIIILFSVLAGDICHAQNKTEPSQNSALATSSSEGQEITAPSPNAIEKDTEEESESVDLSAKDLAVQERMANAAEESNRLVEKQNCIAILGLVFVFLTTVFAGLAWQAAGKGADEAERGVDNEIAARSPLIFVTGVTFRNTQAKLEISIQWTNFGVTPAIAREMWFDYAVVEAIPDEPNFITRADVATHRVLLPREEEDIRVKEVRNPIGTKDIRRCKAGVPSREKDTSGPYLLVWGRIGYDDFLGKRKYSRFGMIASDFNAVRPTRFGRSRLIPESYSYEPIEKEK
ncbi:MAG: hypothetical protein ABJG15_16885 [Hyphomonadaceae bacterium]